MSVPQNQLPLPPKPAAGRPSELLHVSWKNHEVRPNFLHAENIIDYFAHASNPFYDHQCDNEIVRMQRADRGALLNMRGVQYECVTACEPLFVVRKVLRLAVDRVQPLAHYYIIAGVVYQAPDLAAVLNSRLVASLHHLRHAFKMTSDCVRYSRERGYTWHLPSDENPVAAAIRKSETARARDQCDDNSDMAGGSKSTQSRAIKRQKRAANERSTVYQRARTDAILAMVASEFPTKVESGEPGTELPAGLDKGSDEKPDDGKATQPDTKTVVTTAKMPETLPNK